MRNFDHNSREPVRLPSEEEILQKIKKHSFSFSKKYSKYDENIAITFVSQYFQARVAREYSSYFFNQVYNSVS